MAPTVPRAAIPTAKATLLLLAINAVWGGSTLAAKIALYHVPFVTLTFFRFSLSAVLLYGYSIYRQRDLRVARRDWGWFWALGAIGLSATYLLAYAGLSRATAADAALIHSTEPVFLVVLSVVLLRERLTRNKALGAGVGLCGVLLLVPRCMGWGLTGAVDGNVMITLAVIFEALSVVLCKQLLGRYPPLTVLTYQMLTGSIVLAPFVFLEGLRSGWQLPVGAWSWPTIWSLGYLIVPCTLIAYTAWFHLLEKYHAGDLSVYLFVQPIFGTFLGVVFQHDPVTLGLVFGGLLVLCALALIGRQSAVPEPLPPA